MAMKPLQPGTAPANPEARTAQLSSFARVCAEHCPDPDTLDMIANIFTAAAAELREQGRH